DAPASVQGGRLRLNRQAATFVKDLDVERAAVEEGEESRLGLRRTLHAVVVEPAEAQALVELARHEIHDLARLVVGLERIAAVLRRLDQERVVPARLRGAHHHEVAVRGRGRERARDQAVRRHPLHAPPRLVRREPHQRELDTLGRIEERDLHLHALGRLEGEPVLVGRADGSALRGAQPDRPRHRGPAVRFEGIDLALGRHAASLVTNLAGRAGGQIVAARPRSTGARHAELPRLAIPVHDAAHADAAVADSVGALRIAGAGRSRRTGPVHADAARALRVGAAEHTGAALANESAPAVGIRPAGGERHALARVADFPRAAALAHDAAHAAPVLAVGEAGVEAADFRLARIGGLAATVLADRADRA